MHLVLPLQLTHLGELLRLARKMCGLGVEHALLSKSYHPQKLGHLARVVPLLVGGAALYDDPLLLLRFATPTLFDRLFGLGSPTLGRAWSRRCLSTYYVLAASTASLKLGCGVFPKVAPPNAQLQEKSS